MKKVDRIDCVGKILKSLGSFKCALAKAQSKFGSSSGSSIPTTIDASLLYIKIQMILHSVT